MSILDVSFGRFVPSPKLARYVEHFWMVSAPGEQTPRREILIPNGRPLLVLSFASPSVRIDPLTGNRFPNSNMLSGIASQPFVIEQCGESRYIGVQFRPYGLAAFLRGEKLVNRALSIDEWLGKSRAEALNSSLLAHDFGRARVGALDTYLRSVAAEVDGPELQLLGSTLERIEQADGQVKVEELAQQKPSQMSLDSGGQYLLEQNGREHTHLKSRKSSSTHCFLEATYLYRSTIFLNSEGSSVIGIKLLSKEARRPLWAHLSPVSSCWDASVIIFCADLSASNSILEFLDVTVPDISISPISILMMKRIDRVSRHLHHLRIYKRTPHSNGWKTVQSTDLERFSRRTP